MVYRILALLGALFLAPHGTECTCVLHIESPGYPQAARFARIQGDVRLEVGVSREGSVISVSAKSGPAILQQTASENVRKWVFSAGSERNLEILYEFRLVGPEAEVDFIPIPEISYDLPSKVVITSRLPKPNRD